MDWWQIILIILSFIIVGLLVGYLLSYLIVTRVLKKPFQQPFIKKLFQQLFIEKRETTVVVEEPLTSTTSDLFAESLKKREITEQQAKEEQAEREAEEVRRAGAPEEREQKEAPVVEEELTPTAPDLVTEVENNKRIAAEPWTGKLLLFQTHVWDKSSDEINTLPANLRQDLIQAYVDMRLANSIVWMSTELGRRSPNLDENYRKMCTNIGARLDVIAPSLKQSAN